METDSLLVSDLFYARANEFADVPCLGFAGEAALTYREVASLIEVTAARLVSDGIEPGDRVAIVAENMPAWGIAYLAINRAGAIVVPVLPDFPKADVASILAHASVAAVFASARLAVKIPEGVRAYSLEDITSAHDTAPAKSDSAAETGTAARHTPIEVGPRPARQADDTAAIIYTSGTTGFSKGVMLSNRNLVFDAQKTAPIPGIRVGDTLLSILPLAHTYECTIGFLIPISMGCAIYYLRRPPSATVLMPALKAVRPHLMLSVPLLIEKLYRQSVLPSFSKSALVRWVYARGFGRRILNRLAGRKLRRVFGGRLYFFGVGGAGLAPEVEDFLVEARFPYAIGYGLTETSPLIAGANNRNIRLRSTGLPIEGIEVKLAEPLSEEGAGEILVRGPIVMQGYYRDPERTAEVIDSQGYFHTGDLGRFDSRGTLYIIGRVKNMILGPSGENIYPEAIESLLNSVEFVEESVVFQYQGELMARVHVNYEALREHWQGLAEAAAGVPRSIADFLAEVRSSVNTRLSAFSRIGRLIEQAEPFEKTPTNKIKRFLYDKLGIGEPAKGDGGKHD